MLTPHYRRLTIIDRPKTAAFRFPRETHAECILIVSLLSLRDFVVVPFPSIPCGTSFAFDGRSTFRAGNGFTEINEVVEDFDEPFMLKDPIELSGYRVVKAISGKAAVEVARQDPPHLS